MNFNNKNIIIVVIINVIVKLNYIFSIIKKKKNTDHRKNDNITFKKQLSHFLEFTLKTTIFKTAYPNA